LLLELLITGMCLRWLLTVQEALSTSSSERDLHASSQTVLKPEHIDVVPLNDKGLLPGVISIQVC
jgi:hypothetical protein